MNTERHMKYGTQLDRTDETIHHKRHYDCKRERESYTLRKILTYYVLPVLFNLFMKVKAKVTLEEAMNAALMGNGRSSTLSLSRVLRNGGSSTPSPGPIYPKGQRPGTQCKGGWVGHKDGLDG